MEEQISKERKELQNIVARKFLDIDDSVHSYLAKHDIVAQTIRGFKIIDEAPLEMVEELKTRCCLRTRVLKEF